MAFKAFKEKLAAHILALQAMLENPVPKDLTDFQVCFKQPI
jgi:hypothetical protein